MLLGDTARSYRNGPLAQSVRALACHARGRGFEPHAGRHYADLAHLVERHLAKVEVASSSLVIRSIILFKRPEIGYAYGACPHDHRFPMNL